MINGGKTVGFFKDPEPQIDINAFFTTVVHQSNSDVQNIPPEIVEQYFEATAEVNSQELLEGLPSLVGSGTGLSQYLEQADLGGERDVKPICTLKYSMLDNWNDVGDMYQRMKLRKPCAFPDTAIQNHPTLDFELKLPPESKTTKYFYSKEGQLFLRADKRFHFDISFKPNDDSVKFLRLMPVIPSNISKAVIRCENHASKDCFSPQEKKYNVIHSDFPNVIYDGSKEGSSADERLSLVFPLPCSSKGVGENMSATENITIPIEFVCQTSCIGREDVAVIVTLENSSEVLARRTMQVKICSCPKRDVQKKDEELGGYQPRAGSGRKRPMQQQSVQRIGEGKRIKREVSSSQSPPPPPSTSPPNQHRNVGIIANHYISNPFAGLQIYRNLALTFQGFLYENPEMKEEYEPIIMDFRRKARELEARISTLNRTSSLY